MKFFVVVPNDSAQFKKISHLFLSGDFFFFLISLLTFLCDYFFVKTFLDSCVDVFQTLISKSTCVHLVFFG